MELGHDAASSAQPLLAHALFETGEKERANQILRSYIKEHPKDENAAHLFERLNQPPSVSSASNQDRVKGHSATEFSEADVSSADPLPPNWLPPDIDEKVPAVELGTACVAADVVRKAGEQLVNLVQDLDRYTATETSSTFDLNKFGLAALPAKLVRFNYLVSIPKWSHRTSTSRTSQRLDATEKIRGYPSARNSPATSPQSDYPCWCLFFTLLRHELRIVCEGSTRTSRGRPGTFIFANSPIKTNSMLKSYQFGNRTAPAMRWGSEDEHGSMQTITKSSRLESDIVASRSPKFVLSPTINSSNTVPSFP